MDKSLPDKNVQKILRLKEEINQELQELELLMEEIRGLKERLKNPSTYDLRAAGSILHDFYNGVEVIFRRVAQEVNGGLPAGAEWHKQLLKDMSIRIDKVRPGVISDNLRIQLQKYLGFRHIFRNIYGFSLESDRIKSLSKDLEKIFGNLKRELKDFTTFLDSLSQNL
jgi:hypothetical protein